MTPPTPEPGTARPASAGELFVTYCGISLQAFGGALALTERTLVQRKRWFTAKDFLGLYAISQVLPGPTGVSFCVLVGDRFFGLRGASAALAGFLLAPAIIVIALASLFEQFQHLPAVQGTLNGMGAAAVALIVHTAARMAKTLRGEQVGTVVALATFGGVALAGLSVRTVLLLLGPAAVAWAWHKLAGPA
jgi:chromate transporter